MKLLIFTFVAGVLTVNASSTYSQNTTFDLDVSNKTLKEVFQEIESTSEFIFFYLDDAVDIHRKVDLTIKNRNIYEILDELFKNTSNSYKVFDRQVIIFKNESLTPINPILEQSLGTSFIKQQFVIKGKVTDMDGNPLPGVNIVEKGTVNGSITNVDGEYSISVSSPDAILSFSYVGFLTEEIQLDGQTRLNITLVEDIQALDEVVVIGYGTMKKSDLTGSVSSVKVENINKTATASIDNMLSGRVAGLTVQMDAAQPGGAVSVLIRGAASSEEAGNAPLYVIDGFPVSNADLAPYAGTSFERGDTNPLNSINPNDIESIEILKDASATAIYGARAANGVILITTKTGKEGVFDVEYTGSYSIQMAKNPFDMMNASELMEARNLVAREYWLYNNNIAPYGEVDPATAPEFSAPFAQTDINEAGDGTDWFKEVSRNGKIQEHNISIRSGTKKTKYMTSFNYFDQDGILKNSDFTRYTGRINIDQEITSWLNLGIRFTGSSISYQNSQMGGINDNSGVIASAYQYPPFLSVKDDDGNYVINPDRPTVANPVSFLEIDDNTGEQRLFVNSFMNIKLGKDLTAKISFGTDNNTVKRERYYPKTFLYGQLVNGEAYIAEARDVTQLTEAVLNYNRELFSGVKLNAVAGYSWEKYVYESLSASNSDFFTDLFKYNNIGAGASSRPGVSSGKNSNEYISYFSRFHFNLVDKYLLTLTIRADGSSRFGENNKYGYFPSGAFAWRIIEEGFMANLSTISDMKLRVSYGQTGNANIGGNAFAYYETGADYAFANQVNVGVKQSQLANPDLKWETATEMNLGLDIGLFGNHIYGTIEVYKRNVTDLLSQRNLASYLPVRQVTANIGETESKGIEFTLSTINLEGALKWRTDLTLGSFKDRWVERNPEVILPVYEEEDAPMHSYYAFLTDGIVQVGDVVDHMQDAIPGDLKIRDINGVDENGNLTGEPDGDISDADKVLLGSEQPGWSFGLNNTLKYGGFDMSIYFYGMMDRLMYNNNLQMATSMEIVQVNNGMKRFLTDGWSSQNTDGTLPSSIRELYDGDAYDFFMEKASFVRLKNITIGYSFNNTMQVLNSLKSFRIYLDMNNLFVLTNYSGGDPEIDDWAAYPFPKTFSLGLNVKF